MYYDIRHSVVISSDNDHLVMMKGADFMLLTTEKLPFSESAVFTFQLPLERNVEGL